MGRHLHRSGTVVGIAHVISRVHGTESPEPPASASGAINRPRVEVALPTPGGLEQVASQPGSVDAFDAARLYAKVSGYLKEQYVDIGDKVKKGQLLAVIDVPELLKEADRRAAELKDSQAQVAQMTSRIATAHAAAAGAQATIKQAEADLLRTKAALEFAQKQHDRVKYLFQLKSVDERLVDEKLESLGTAQGAESTSEAAIATAKASLASAQAKIAQAKVDLDEATAKVSVYQANLERTQVLVGYTKIVSPYNGVITLRNFHPGDADGHQPDPDRCRAHQRPARSLHSGLPAVGRQHAESGG